LTYVAEAYPELKVVVAHLGGEHCPEVLRHAEVNTNVFLEMSTLEQTSEKLSMRVPADVLRAVIDRVGPGRVLFGSDLLRPRRPYALDRVPCRLRGRR
jgi:predicted TIM-barrel fold metal-dependent hydrolase